MHTQPQFTQLTQNKEKQQTKIQFKVQCVGKNKPIQFCLNESCSHNNIFTCFQEECQCHIQHKQCSKELIQNAVKKIKSRIIVSTQVIKEDIYKRFDKLIDQLSDSRDKIIVNIQQQIKQCQITKDQIKFLNLIQNQISQPFQLSQIKFIKSLMIEKSETQSFNSQLIFDLLRQSLNSLNDIRQSNHKQLKIIIDEVDDRLKNISSIRQVPKLSQFLLKSSILVNFQQINKLASFFPNKLTEIKLLYKASQNQFSIVPYWQKCAQQTHTLIICKTNKDKIIGGYSPLSHLYNGQGQQQNSDWGEFKIDHTKTSFIFSLTNNDKFELQKSQKAIFRNIRGESICFGNDDFSIGHQSNINKNCKTRINQFYFNKKYKSSKYMQDGWSHWKHDKDSCMSLNGNENDQFSTKQWQVWKIVMQNQTKKQQQTKVEI